MPDASSDPRSARHPGSGAFASPNFAADMTVDGVPLPVDVLITHADTPLQRQWGGAWVGVWDGVLYQKHILLVEAITDDGSAQVTYAVGDSPFRNIQRQWTRHKATVSERNLSISEPDLSVTYEAKGKDALAGTYVRGADRSRAIMMRVDQGALTTPGAVVDWLGGRSEFLQTDLVEGGKPVRLEAIIFKPSGSGPFPLAVFNHGSTGDGRTPAKFKHTMFFIDLATFLNERGLLVAFPQRRGRGKSDGEYDEGFPPDRAQGYACEPEIALAGAKRGLGDIEAAVAALRRRPDVAASRILMAGQSRGGSLSVAYAGDHADQTFGVINFAGGWLSEQRCPEAKLVSQTLFKQGVNFGRPTIWLYGRNDPFYSIPFSQANFSAFQDAGGQGVFLEYDVPGGNGHMVISHPSLWSTPVGSYLDSLAAAQK